MRASLAPARSHALRARIMRVRIYLAREVIRRVWRPRVLRTAVGALWCAGGGCIGVVLGLGRVLAYWAAGVLEGWIRGCGGGSEGVTPDSPQITQITPKWPKRVKMVIFGVFGVIQAKRARMGISRPRYGHLG